MESIARPSTREFRGLKLFKANFGGWAELWREACVTMAGQLADQRASWGEIRPQSWPDFLAHAEEELEEAEYDAIILGDHGELLRLLREMAAEPRGDDLEDSYKNRG